MPEQQPPTGSGQPAGFYPDNTGTMRFWDGTQWTEHTQGGTATAAPESAWVRWRV
jgi:hypothetical protein